MLTAKYSFVVFQENQQRLEENEELRLQAIRTQRPQRPQSVCEISLPLCPSPLPHTQTIPVLIVAGLFIVLSDDFDSFDRGHLAPLSVELASALPAP